MNLKTFYDYIRTTIPLTNKNVKGFDFLITEGLKREIPLFFLAYILATVYHETAATMQPIAEYGRGRGKKYGVKGKYGQIPYGRGYVQLTWDYNYEKADKELGLNGTLLKNFDRALEPSVAAPILFKGMEEGWFTGKKLSDYIDNIDEDDKEDLREFSNARRIVNGTDKQVLIGQYALTFKKALRASGYEGVPVPEEVAETPVRPSLAEPEPIQETTEKKSIFELIFEIILKLLKR